MSAPKPATTGNPIERYTGDGSDPVAISRPRKIEAWLIRAAGLLIGAALAALYIFMMWVSPPDLSHARPGAAIGMYLGLPLLFLFGPFWLADWLAAFIDKRRVSV